MTIPIVVPSYRRAATLARKTLPLLLSRRVPASGITVVVASEAEADSYRTAIADAGLPAVELVVGVPGMGAVRNWIADHWRGPVLQVDDDLTDLRRMVDPKTTVPLDDLPTFAEDGFLFAEQAGAGLWGIYPVPNPYFMRNRITVDLRYIEGGFWGAVLTGAPHQQVTLDDKEDYERSLRYYLADGSVVRVDYVTMVTKFYTEPGGMQEERTEERVTASAHALADRYPELCRLNLSKKSGHAELRLRDRRGKK